MLLTNKKVVKALGVLQEASKNGEINIFSQEERVIATINEKYEFRFVEGINSKEIILIFRKKPNSADGVIEENELSRITSKHKLLKGYKNVLEFILDPKNADAEDYSIFRTYKIVDNKIVCFVDIELGEIDEDEDGENKVSFEFNYEVADQCWIAKDLLRELDKDFFKCLVE